MLIKHLNSYKMFDAFDSHFEKILLVKYSIYFNDSTSQPQIENA